MTAIDFLVEKLKLESIDLSLWHQNLIDEANKMLKQQMKEAQIHYVGDSLGFKTILENQFEDWYNEKYGNKNSECQCFRLGDGSPWQTYLCEIHKETI